MLIVTMNYYVWIKCTRWKKGLLSNYYIVRAFFPSSVSVFDFLVQFRMVHGVYGSVTVNNMWKSSVQPHISKSVVVVVEKFVIL